MKQEHERPSGERDDVARLVRLAGKRQAVPHERAERVRAAARFQWQGDVQRRSRKRWVGTAAVLVAAASLVLVLAVRLLPERIVQPGPVDTAMLVETLAGQAWSRDTAVGQPSEPRAVGIGDSILLGSELTTAQESRAAILLASGHSVRLDAATTIRMLESGALALDRGAIYVDSGPGETTVGSLDVHTPFGVIQEIGTQFEVRMEDDSISVRLREGAVIVHRDERSHQVQVGTELQIGPDGSVTRQPIPRYGPEWDWIVGVTPMLDLEGRSARAFLDWVARERGWKLAFEDESVALSADDVVLSGTVRRLTLDEALDAVLPTCRMTYQVNEDMLLVSAEPE